ncbi:Outer membrane usher protein fimD precursor [Serratia quinivorans]|uniref:Fimbrial biogenesis usher protein n=1 Tax=Serratia quinivorans TaxID=137545 RepID=A0ABV3UGJ8_9GAMM|nr:fimbrial biogenesis usher protein [Serratia quinivorans]CAI1567271.1 Outer membrane usher protein fimD precursor [Serratia quinivorans]CAI1695855.1 Outer membrane usher protein fimD precursor [Serratia quinivorans]
MIFKINSQHDTVKVRAAITPVALALCIALMTTPAWAEMYFNPAFLSDDPSAVADLSRFQQGGGQAAGKYQVDIYVNQDLYKTQTLTFREKKTLPAEQTPIATDATAVVDLSGGAAEIPDDGTGLSPCLTVEMLTDMGVKATALTSLANVPKDQCINIEQALPGAYTSFDFSKLQLNVSIPQAVMSNDVRGYIPPDRWDQGIPALLFNYNFTGSNNRGDFSSDNYFLSLNSGVNLGGWRLRDNSTWNYMRGSGMATEQSWEHISTYIAHTVALLKSEFVAGDITSPSEVFSGLPMKGVMLVSDDNMLPDSQRGFAPTVRGIANSNSQVTITQNGYSVYQTYVPAGPFVISDLYSLPSSGDLQVTVTGSDGGTNTYTVPFSSVPMLQREGRIKYSLASGKYRSGNDEQEDVSFTQGTLQWGLSHGLTAYGGMQYADNYQAQAVGLGLNLGDFGGVSFDVTLADSTLADGSQHRGQSYRAMWSKSLVDTGTNLQLATTRFSTQGFYTLDQTTYKVMSGYSYQDVPDVALPSDQVAADSGDYYNLNNTQKNQVQASISQNIGENGKFGSVYLSGTRTSYWNTEDRDSSWQLGYSDTISDISYSLNYSYNKSAGMTEPNQQFSLNFSVPLDKWLSAGAGSNGDITKANGNSAYANYSMSTDNSGYTSNQVGISGTMLENNNLSYSVTQGMQNQGGGNNGSASLSYQGGYGNSNIAYNYDQSYQSVNYGLSGGIVVHQHGVTFSQPLGGANILVAAPGADNVSVSNTTGVSTDWRGYAVVPYANTYHENEVSLESGDLPTNVDLEDSVKKVVPTSGALVLASFKTRVGERVLLTLMRNGKPLPFGATVSPVDSDNSGIVGDNGQVYLAGLSPEGRVLAQWGNGPDQQCHASYRLPATPDSGKQVNIQMVQAECG